MVSAEAAVTQTNPILPSFLAAVASQKATFMVQSPAVTYGLTAEVQPEFHPTQLSLSPTEAITTALLFQEHSSRGTRMF